MNYPLISEYIEAIRTAEYNFDKLNNLRPILDCDGNPILSSGNFAVVFKMKDIDTDKTYAVKCFTREQEGREDRYREIAKVLKQVKSPYFVSVQYYDKELFVDTSQDNETEFPVLLMDWVEGTTLDKYVLQYKGNPFALHELCYNFRFMAKWLLSHDLAHGDIKPDNILVRDDGDIVLIDYDGLFIQSKQGDSRRELGSPNFTHPYREPTYDSHMDDFALAITALSLKLMSVSFGIIDEYGANDCLLFRKTDYQDLNNSKLIKLICKLIISDDILGLYYSTFIKAYSGNVLAPEDFDFVTEKDVEELLHFWNTNDFISEDRKKSTGVCSKDGVIYNKEENSVIGFVYSENTPKEIHIKEGTICICEDAFDYQIKSKLKIHLPSTLRYFNPKSFNYKYSVLSWDSPWFTYSNGYILTKDHTEVVLKDLVSAQFDKSARILGQHLFDSLVFDDWLPEQIIKIRHSAFSDTHLSESFRLPINVSVIGDYAFRRCSLKELVFPSTLRRLGKYCFQSGKHLQLVDLSTCNITEIPNGCFCNCEQLKNVYFSNFTKKIEESAFFGCESIETLNFPESLEEIMKGAFSMCNFNSWEFPMDDFYDEHISQLQTIIFPNKLKYIGPRSFSNLKELKSITFSSDMDIIGDEAFKDCCNLETINYKTINYIGKASFSGCKLKLTITDGIKEITVGALNGCAIISNKSGRFIINQDSLYTEHFEKLIYSWNTNTIIELPEGIQSIDKLAFLSIPRVLVLPYSFDKKHIKDTLFCDVVVVPKHFPLENHFNNTLITHEKVLIDNYGVIYTEDKHVLIRYPSSLPHKCYSIASECVKIGDYAFEGDEDPDPEFGVSYIGNSLEELILPNNLKCIGVGALEGCRNLPTLFLPDSVNELNDFALNGCHSIRQICLPSSLLKIGTKALPSNLTYAKSRSSKFHCCSDCLLSDKNELLWISPNIKMFDLPHVVLYKGKKCISYHNCIVSSDGELLLTIPNIDYFDFPIGVKIIANGAFRHNKVIKKIIIPNGVVSIESGAFNYNQELKAIYLPKTIRHIGSLRTRQGWGRKYIKDFYPEEVHIPKGMEKHFKSMMPDIPESTLIDDNCY